MADDNPAQGLLDGYSKIMKKVRDVLGDPDKPAQAKKVDESWHNEMVKRANDSFKVAAEQKPTVKTGKKPVQRKRTSSKR